MSVTKSFTASQLIQALQKRFPFPVPYSDLYPGENTYCVGHAPCWLTSTPETSEEGFPHDSDLALSLRQINSCLSEEKAAEYASRIAELNDQGFIAEAWAILREAVMCLRTEDRFQVQWPDEGRKEGLPVKKIMATFHPQAWLNDHAIEVDGAKQFDVTGMVLKLSAKEIRELDDNNYDTDDFAQQADLVDEHTGPFWVEVAAQVDAFLESFGFDRGTLTDAQLQEIRPQYADLPGVASRLGSGSSGSTQLQLTDQELHTILAALRYYQRGWQCASVNRSDWIDNLATNGGKCAALDTDDINELCERLNTT